MGLTDQRIPGALCQVGRRRWPVLAFAAFTMTVVVLVSVGSYRPGIYDPVRDAANKLKDHVRGGQDRTKSHYVGSNSTLGFEDAASNRTLGLESIQFINMDYRYDRFDALAIQCYLSDIEVHTSPGFPKDKAGSEMVGFPPTSAPARLGPPEVATWRAHATIWQQMLLKRSPAVLIVESDAVWDTQIRRIMGNLNRPFLDLLRADNPDSDIAASQDDPWAARSGLWDVISVGHCGDHWRDDTGFRLYDDEFAARGSRDWYGHDLGGKRVVYRANGMVCTTGYIVSLKGAAKLLVRTAMNLNEPIDLIMNMMIKSHNLVGYNVQRQPIAQWVYSSGLGMESRGANSDIRPNGSESSQSGDDGSRENYPEAEKKGSVWEIKPQYAGVDFPDFGLGQAWEKVAETKMKLHFTD